ncbi:viral A-type inclusion protein [Planoprotostelium fungivorum]|uniref:Viral A-type inclusion protein n=1 Tax=Planoprotostelium fungivorum TaxID=1890364 RepID=A0A2P6N9H5_9EUKA|nr:viral A-type inclusion protein [Planoprotostelium fungivorum]
MTLTEFQLSDETAHHLIEALLIIVMLILTAHSRRSLFGLPHPAVLPVPPELSLMRQPPVESPMQPSEGSPSNDRWSIGSTARLSLAAELENVQKEKRDLYIKLLEETNSRKALEKKLKLMESQNVTNASLLMQSLRDESSNKKQEQDNASELKKLVGRLELKLKQRETELAVLQDKFDVLHKAYEARKDGDEEFQRIAQVNSALQKENAELRFHLGQKRGRGPDYSDVVRENKELIQKIGVLEKQAAEMEIERRKHEDLKNLLGQLQETVEQEMADYKSKCKEELLQSQNSLRSELNKSSGNAQELAAIKAKHRKELEDRNDRFKKELQTCKNTFEDFLTETKMRHQEELKQLEKRIRKGVDETDRTIIQTSIPPPTRKVNLHINTDNQNNTPPKTPPTASPAKTPATSDMNPSALTTRVASRGILSRFTLRGGYGGEHHTKVVPPTGNKIVDDINAADAKLYGHGYLLPGETVPGKSKILFIGGFILGFGFPVFAAAWQKSYPFPSFSISDYLP